MFKPIEILEKPLAIEELLKLLIKKLGLSKMVFLRYLPVGGGRIFEVRADQISGSNFSIESLEDDFLIPHEQGYRKNVIESTTGLTSLVMVKNRLGWLHLPLLRLRVSMDSIDRSKSIKTLYTSLVSSEICGQDEFGFIIKSGSNLHYYGSCLRTHSEWMKWMNKARGLAEVGLSYGTYALQETFSTVRIGVNSKLHPVRPIAVATWDYNHS